MREPVEGFGDLPRRQTPCALVHEHLCRERRQQRIDHRVGIAGARVHEK